LFEDEWFENHKRKTMDEFVNSMKKYLDIDRIIKAVS
jgi:hypothetical protein